jgi:carbon-monoxide dehydrogenase small subunit
MKRELKLTVNGEPYEVFIEPRTTLLSLIRDHLGLSGTKEGCSEGMCGACTVLVDGKAIKSCLVLALQVHGKEVVTIEGLAQGGQLHPVQDSFIEHGAVQCGFCTPGMVLTAKAFLDEHQSPTEEDVKFAIAGNLCRCTGYVKIIEAVKDAASRKR